MSHSIVLSVASSVRDLIAAASMQDRPLPISQIFAFCATEDEKVDALKQADRMGVEVKGHQYEHGQAAVMMLFFMILIIGIALVAMAPISGLLHTILNGLSGI